MTKEYYLVVFLTESGSVKIESMTKPQIEGFAKAMHDRNFAVIAGWLVKGFDEKLNIARLAFQGGPK